jgi:hypothetical protein
VTPAKTVVFESGADNLARTDRKRTTNKDRSARGRPERLFT